jgi:hypothetical protein
MVAAGGDECGLTAETLGEFEAENAAVEVEGAVEVGDFEVDVSNAGSGRDRRCGFHSFIVDTTDFSVTWNK